MITRYKEYLDFLDRGLAKMFQEQRAFIKCKEGCAYCCKEGEYPISELEYINLMFYYNLLEDDIKDRVNENIDKLLKSERKKMYECPFLVDNKCSVYPFRAIICRTFGLISYDGKDKKRIPFCVSLGLNYANVYDTEQKMIMCDAEDGTQPVAYHVDRRYLRSEKFEKEFDIFFGEDKPLVEWLREEDFD